ncbi:DUF4192 family protein [Demequina sp. SYSU T00068]|uniref:DUF4192 family protein n=1 Tax=Demequina lignilytica TaxID=3051663 RepID=UPI00262DBC9C|nr:DUF4192 family protein [Demequina sp. SYSU T00068]MDN4489249.1 DUF4192 family protein [Demequina sp. SYSU T00068]
MTDLVVAYFTERDAATLRMLDEELTHALEAAGTTRARTVLVDAPATGVLRRDLAAIAPAHPAAVKRAARAFSETTPSLSDYLAALERVRHARYIPAAMVGAAGACLRSPLWRDVVVILMAGVSLPDMQILEHDGLSEDLATQALSVLLRRSAPPTAEAHQHEALLTQIVAHLDPTDQAPARCLLALIAWWRGDGATANRHLEEALIADHEYRLAELIAMSLTPTTPMQDSLRS